MQASILKNKDNPVNLEYINNETKENNIDNNDKLSIHSQHSIISLNSSNKKKKLALSLHSNKDSIAHSNAIGSYEINDHSSSSEVNSKQQSGTEFYKKSKSKKHGSSLKKVFGSKYSLPAIQNKGLMSNRHKYCGHYQGEYYDVNIKKKKEWYGPITNGITDTQFLVNHPREPFPDCFNNQKNEYIKVIDNNNHYNPSINPYIRMVNQAMMMQGRQIINFKSKNYYEKSHELSLLPKLAKYDSNNPIFLHMANPHDYRFYQVEHI